MTAPIRDQMRDWQLGEQGFSVVRNSAQDVLRDLESVVIGIVARCVARGPLHRPADGPPPRPGEDRP